MLIPQKSPYPTGKTRYSIIILGILGILRDKLLLEIGRNGEDVDHFVRSSVTNIVSGNIKCKIFFKYFYKPF